MKKNISILFLFFSISIVNAQDISDALRYSQTDMNGTARFRALSGAFGALGGDMSAISINPASSVIFANNQVALTANNYSTKNDSDYFGSKNTQRNNSFDFNQVGGVLLFENVSTSSGWKKFALAINYDKLSNFNNSFYSEGLNKTNSIDKYFLYYANSIPFGNINVYNYSDLNFAEQQADLAYNSFIIDADNTNQVYFTNISDQGNYYQSNSFQNKGYNGKLAFNLSAQYEDKLMIGVNLNSHFSDFTQSKKFIERNSNPKYAIGSTVDNIAFYNDLHTYGNGFSFQVGAIYKLTPEFRLGLTYESPTWMKLNDELTQSIATSGYGLNNPVDNTVYGNVVYNPRTTIYYAPYNLSTPDKWTFSGAYVFGKEGFISFDYSTKDYSTIEFSPSSDFKSLNKDIPVVLGSSNEYRLGIERKLKQWSLRGGYRFESSPYKDKDIMGDLTGFSGGIGYNWGSTKLDFAYSTAKRTYAEQMFNRGLTDPATVTKRNSNFTVTLAFEL